MDRTKIEYDEAGQPKNLGVVLDDLVKDKPYLAGSANQRPRAGGWRLPIGAAQREGVAVAARVDAAELAAGRRMTDAPPFVSADRYVIGQIGPAALVPGRVAALLDRELRVAPVALACG